MEGKGSLQEPISHLPLHSRPTPRTTSCKVGFCVFQGGFSRALCCCPRWRCPAGQRSSLSPSAKAPGACLTEGAGEPSGSCGERRGTFRKLWRVSFIQSPVQGLPEPWGHTGRASEAMTGARSPPGAATGSVLGWRFSPCGSSHLSANPPPAKGSILTG